METVWTRLLTVKISRPMTSSFLMTMWRHPRNFQRKLNCSLLMLRISGMPIFVCKYEYLLVFFFIDTLGATLANHLDKPRLYIGCMKSGEVFSEPGHRWYEPDWWKFGDKKTYFRHASGEMYAISRALAKFISINRLILRSYAHDDVSAGSWFIGLDVQHLDESKFCCSSWSSGAICAGV
ncbi:hypothetical protein EZV62_006034 [Acer yangbiense]|uniref:Hexosyltransferase n=1 Tax=Acer yangbiense TaxID=1000413 RepID=A0A5C7IPV2_9ROSI|nr:hypothetical protein EZV62_006034 [Acer yangbiense]